MMSKTRTSSFSVSSADPSNAIRSPRFPVLESGNSSFPNGKYTVELEPCDDRCSYRITHKIEGAPLISRLLEDNKAKYVCTVSSPISSYRKTHLSDSPEQTVGWNQDDLGEPPLLTPMIVCYVPEKEDIRLDAGRDGVNEIWHEQVITLLKGSRIALGSLIRFRSSSILQLLRLTIDEDLGDGQFSVDAETASDFRFQVKLSPKLHSFLQKKSVTRENIMTNVVTACLALLQRDTAFWEDKNQDDEGEFYRSLDIFADHLRENNLPHWSDPDFQPEVVATKLYPHSIPEQPDDE